LQSIRAPAPVRAYLLKNGRTASLDVVDAFFCANCASRFDVAGG
jgi:hypothetical protein